MSVTWGVEQREQIEAEDYEQKVTSPVAFFCGASAVAFGDLLSAWSGPTYGGSNETL